MPKDDNALKYLFEGFEGLMNAVTYDAMKDYVKLTKMLWKINNELERTKKFFLHECESTTGLDGEYLMKRMNEVLKEEGYL